MNDPYDNRKDDDYMLKQSRKEVITTKIGVVVTGTIENISIFKAAIGLLQEECGVNISVIMEK